MNINRVILRTVIEIVLLISFIFVTIPVWDNLGKNSYASVAAYYDGYSRDYITLYSEKMADLTGIIPVSDEVGSTTNVSNITVSNVSDNNKNYGLYLSVDNNSDLDINYLKVSINGKTNYIKDLEKTVKENKTLYLLDESNITGKELVHYDIYTWLSEQTPNSEQGKTLSINYNVEERSLLASK